MLDVEGVRDRLAALSVPDGLCDMPAEDPLGLRARDSDVGVVELFLGSVLDDPGRLRPEESGRWKLGVRRIPVVGVLGALPSQLSND